MIIELLAHVVGMFAWDKNKKQYNGITLEQETMLCGDKKVAHRHSPGIAAECQRNLESDQLALLCPCLVPGGAWAHVFPSLGRLFNPFLSDSSFLFAYL